MPRALGGSGIAGTRGLFLGGAVTPPVVIIPPVDGLADHIMAFGHSQLQQGFSIYDGFDTLTAGDPTTATSSFKSFRHMGADPVSNALSRIGHRLLYLVTLDPTGTIPGPGSPSTFAPYVLGDNYAKGGGQISHASAAMDQAYAAGVSGKAGFIFIGTNELPLDEGDPAAFEALLLKANTLWPATEWLVFDVAPTADPAVIPTATNSGRTAANVTAGSAVIADKTAAAGPKFHLIPVCQALRDRGNGTYARTSDMLGDGVHFSTFGGGVMGRLAADKLLELFPENVNLRRPLFKGTGVVKDTVRLFTGTPLTTWSQPASGTRLFGSRPPALATVSATGTMGSSCTFSVIDNPDTSKVGGKAVQIVIDPGANGANSNTAEQLYIILASNLLNTSGSLAGKVWQSCLRQRDSQPAQLLNTIWDVFDSFDKPNRIFKGEVSTEPLGATGDVVREIYTPPKRGAVDMTQMTAEMTIRWNPSVSATPFTIIIDLDLDEMDDTKIQATAVA